MLFRITSINDFASMFAIRLMVIVVIFHGIWVVYFDEVSVVFIL